MGAIGKSLGKVVGLGLGARYSAETVKTIKAGGALFPDNFVDTEKEKHKQIALTSIARKYNVSTADPNAVRRASASSVSDAIMKQIFFGFPLPADIAGGLESKVKSLRAQGKENEANQLAKDIRSDYNNALLEAPKILEKADGNLANAKKQAAVIEKKKEQADIYDVYDLTDSLRATYKKKKAQLEDVLANGFKEGKYSEKFSELSEKYRIIKADENTNSMANLVFKGASIDPDNPDLLDGKDEEQKYVWTIDGEEKGTYKLLFPQMFPWARSSKTFPRQLHKKRLPIEREIQQDLRRRINFIDGLLDYDRTYDAKQKEKKRDEEEERLYKQEIYRQREDDRRERERSRERNVQSMQAFQNRFASQQQAFQNDYVNSQRAFQDSINQRFNNLSSGLANQQRSFMEQSATYFDDATGNLRQTMQRFKLNKKRKSTAPVGHASGDILYSIFQRKDGD